jgi:hypothetical protein
MTIDAVTVPAADPSADTVAVTSNVSGPGESAGGRSWAGVLVNKAAANTVRPIESPVTISSFRGVRVCVRLQ